jgi:LacI family transcriptional regulator
MARITQRDIADALGVSVVTVSNALSGKKGVSEELRGEIIRKAEELGMNPEKYGTRSM